MGRITLLQAAQKELALLSQKKLIEEGANVLITGRNHEQLRLAKEQLGLRSSIIQFDNSEVSSVGNLLEESKKALGKIDGLVLNAGISFHEGNFLNVTVGGFDKQFDVNLKANYFLAQEFIKYKLEAHESGDILFISSETAPKCNDIPY